MSGIFGHDGYLYQSIVVANLLLEHLSQEDGLSSFLVEVEEEEDFSVDCVIICRNTKKAFIYEVKGGRFSISETLKKLQNCEDKLKKVSLIEKDASSYIYIIYKNEKQISEKKRDEYSNVLLQRPNNISERSSIYSLGSLELDSLEKCRDLIRKLIPDFDSERQKRLIYLFIKSAVDQIIQHKAEQLRRKTTKDISPIDIKEFLSGWTDSFSQLVAELYPNKFSNGEAVYSALVDALVLKDRKKADTSGAIKEY
jgi:hypothetical protein